jgi:hypothetical protein
MSLRALKDTRTADWSEIANFTRGWLEYLVEYNNDGRSAACCWKAGRPTTTRPNTR